MGSGPSGVVWPWRRVFPALNNCLRRTDTLTTSAESRKGRTCLAKVPCFTDSDTYKWIEAVGLFLQSGHQPQLRAQADAYIDDIVAVQEPSGYLNTYWVGDRAKERLLPETMDTGHELYCLGHMIQAAIAYY